MKEKDINYDRIWEIAYKTILDKAMPEFMRGKVDGSSYVAWAWIKAYHSYLRSVGYEVVIIKKEKSDR